ncbi:MULTISPECIES: SCO4225 family membrane protein [unclassified Streptomyces]|uniref:SCO4225 family membrane protein n=1 Tax=unclassified Streptomyces TaxID=2593676 RepID=UPI0036E0D43E
MARSARPRLPRLRALLAPAVDNWLARGYLAVVVASLGFFLWAAYLSPDPGFAAIWPLMTTAPLSMVVSVPLLALAPAWDSPLEWLSPLLFTTGMALCGLINAALLGLLARRVSTRGPHPAA